MFFNKGTFCNKCPDPFKDKVKCEECKHYIDTCDSQSITVKVSFFKPYFRYYCPLHKKPYSEFRSGGWDSKDTYWNLMEVDENGVPVGYEPKK